MRITVDDDFDPTFIKGIVFLDDFYPVTGRHGSTDGGCGLGYDRNFEEDFRSTFDESETGNGTFGIGDVAIDFYVSVHMSVLDVTVLQRYQLLANSCEHHAHPASHLHLMKYAFAITVDGSFR